MPRWFAELSLKKLSDRLALLPIGSLIRDPGPYRDLFDDLGPYKVFISMKRSLFLWLCDFFMWKRPKIHKLMFTFIKVEDNIFRGYSNL